VVLSPRKRQGNPRKWCSEACRVRTYTYETGVKADLVCLWCHASFTPFRSDQRYCSKKCSQLYHIKLRRDRRGQSIPEPRDCPECGTTFTPKPCNAIRARWCSQRCVNNDVKRRHRARLVGATVTPVTPWSIFERDRWICQLCGGPIDRDVIAPHPRSKSIDHIVPLSLGGAHTNSNLQTAHFQCNQIKK
jgi:5-methylcytosine-specific restriction endonuclease McrA